MNAEIAVNFDLQQFCGRNDPRSYICEPFVMDGYRYATDGRVIVRIPAPDAPENPPTIAKAVRRIFAESFDESGFVEMPAIPAPVHCNLCDGSGEDDDGDPCWRCDGSGEEFAVVEVGNAQMQARYLRLLSTLPNVRINAPSPTSATAFIFDGGEGRLMPCRT